MRVVLITSGDGWILDRIAHEMARLFPFHCTVQNEPPDYSQLFCDFLNTFDLAHWMSWGSIYKFFPWLGATKIPKMFSIRSFRWENYVFEAARLFDHVHVLQPDQLKIFPNATYIPDGIFEQFKPDHEFVVGYAGKPDEYKGIHLIKQACEELGVQFKPATGNYKGEDMVDYYRSIDLYVCASIAEGHSTCVMECLAMNKPVITTDVGIPRYLNVHKVDRTVESIKQGISKFYTAPQVKEFTWQKACDQFEELYIKLCSI